MPYDTTRESMHTTPASPKEYRNFDLSIRRRDDGLYALRAQGPRDGVTGRDGVEIGSPKTVDGKDIGRYLFESVFQGEILASFRSSLLRARDTGHGLRLRLRLNDAPELATCPWELLYDTEDTRYLGHSNDTPIVRYLEMRQPHVPLSVDLPLRVLVIASSPKTLYPLDTEAEWQQLKASLADLENQGQVILHRLQPPTRDGLQRTLRRQPPHVVHFIGHGDVLEIQGQDTGVIFLETEDGDRDVVPGNLLGVLLHDAKAKLVVLNSCRSAVPVPDAHLSGIAEQLLRHDVPAVVGMGDEIDDDDAQLLARHFYGALADGLPVDASLGEARKALAMQDGNTAWSLPCLFMRCDDGVLFRLPTATSDSLQDAEASPLVQASPKRRRLIRVALLFIILVLASWGTLHLRTGHMVRQLNAQALELLDAQRFEDARQTVQEAIDRKPSHAPSWSNLGAVEDAAGQGKEALQAYERAADLDPDNALHRFNVASALLDHRLFERAIEQLLAALELEPRHGPAHNDLGWAYLELDRHDLARPWLAQGLQLDNLGTQTRAALHKNYGRLSLETDDLPSAERHLLEALRGLDPVMAQLRLEARLLLAATRDRQGEAEQACRHLEQFVQEGGLLYRWSVDPLDLARRLPCPINPDPSTLNQDPSPP